MARVDVIPERIRSSLPEVVARIRVVLSSALTYLTIAAAALPLVIPILADELGADNQLVIWATTAAGVLASAVAIIRRVSEVIPDDRGLLPLAEPPTLTNYYQEDA